MIGKVGKSRRKKLMMFHSIATSGRIRPIQNRRRVMKSGSRPFPGSIIWSGTCASGKANRSRSTHCRLRITIPHIVPAAIAATSMPHQASGMAHSPQGIRSPSGMPWKNHSIIPPSLVGKAQRGRCGRRRFAHWFSGVAK